MGSTVDVSFNVSGSETLTRTGQVLGLESSLDPQARTARYWLESTIHWKEMSLPLMIGAYMWMSLLWDVM